MLRKPLYAHALGDVLAEYSRSIRGAYDAAEVRTARGQAERLQRASFALDELQNEEGALERPHSLARARQAWTARLDAVEESLFDLIESMGRPDSQAKIDHRYRLMRRAIRGEIEARRQALRGLDVGGSVPLLRPETSES